MRRSRVLIAAAVTVATLLAGVGVAYAAIGKTVTVTVDGQRQQLRTFASTVGGALDKAGVRRSSRDLVVPAESSALRGGALITVRHARQLSLIVDGRRRTVWVLADSVGQALDQLGLNQSGALLSASRSGRIPLTGMDLRVRLPHAIRVLVDNHVRRVTSTDPTVRAVLARLRIRLASTDRVSLPLAAYPADGVTIRVTRVRNKLVSDTIAIGFSTIRRADAALPQGQTRTQTAGSAGTIRRTFLATFVDGRLAGKRLVRQQQTAAPVTAVVYYGTQVAAPAPPPPPAAPAPSYSGGYGGLNWGELAACESGGNPRAVSPGGLYRGLYQFSMSTWASVGGVGDPINASPAEQTYRAWVLYQRSGRSPWPICGQYL